MSNGLIAWWYICEQLFLKSHFTDLHIPVNQQKQYIRPVTEEGDIVVLFISSDQHCTRTSASTRYLYIAMVDVELYL